MEIKIFNSLKEEKTFIQQLGNRELYYFEVNITRNRTVIYSYQHVADKYIDNYVIDIVYKQLIIQIISGGLMIKEGSKYFKEPINLP